MTINVNDVCDQYCVFRADDAEYAVSADLIREVADLVPIVPVPDAPSVLVGMCHLRTEFIPVLGVNPLIGAGQSRVRDASYLLVFAPDEGPWALLIQRALTLEVLEVGFADSVNEWDNVSRIAQGTATYRDSVVRVLDANRLYRIAAEILDAQWSNSRGGGPESNDATTPSSLLPV